jgi:hypothetical protein
VLIDGPVGQESKADFLRRALERAGENGPLHAALARLRSSHQQLFGASNNKRLMVRSAADPAFRRFGIHMARGEALARTTERSDAEVQAFQTIFETGQNTRGYVHKLECHGEAVEFIYAITDIVYGVMLPSNLSFETNRIVADPAKVEMFYVRAGEVIALHPYVLHSGSLSVEPDRSFAILIYKKPAEDEDRVVALPSAWDQGQHSIRIPGVDKWYLTLDELHVDALKANRGFIADRRPIRLPNWQ